MNDNFLHLVYYTSKKRRYKHDINVGARLSCDKQQQAMTPSSITMDAINAITNHDSHNQCNYCQVPKCTLNKPLKCNKEGRGNKPQSHKAALLTNVTKSVRRALWVLQKYSSCNNNYCHRSINICNVCATNANCNILPTSAGATGCMLNATTATIVTISMANASSTSSTTMAVVATTSTTTRRDPPHARTRASSPATYTASTPIARQWLTLRLYWEDDYLFMSSLL